MEKIKTLAVALDYLVNKNAILCKHNKGNVIYYVYKDNMIMLFNTQLKGYISIDNFKDDFYINNYYLYDNTESILEIDQEIKPIRQ